MHAICLPDYRVDCLFHILEVVWICLFQRNGTDSGIGDVKTRSSLVVEVVAMLVICTKVAGWLLTYLRFDETIY